MHVSRRQVLRDGAVASLGMSASMLLGRQAKAAGAQTGAPIALSFGCPALCCPDQVSTAFGPAFMPQGRA